VNYNLYLVSADIRWDRGSSEPAYEYASFSGNRDANHHLGTGFQIIYPGIKSPVTRVKFIRDRMSYIKLRVR